jgi:hypothetical protein
MWVPGEGAGGPITQLVGGGCRCSLMGGSHRTIDRHALKMPARGAKSPRTENVTSPFQAEPRYRESLDAPAVFFSVLEGALHFLMEYVKESRSADRLGAGFRKILGAVTGTKNAGD